MSTLLQDVYSIQTIYGPGANLRAPAPQTIKDKEAIIANSKQTIDEMKKLFAAETNLDHKSVVVLMSDRKKMAEYLKTATKKVNRIVEIIENQKELIAGAQLAIKVFKRHEARQQAEMERIRKINQH